jgi:hypothetical protein
MAAPVPAPTPSRALHTDVVEWFTSISEEQRLRVLTVEDESWVHTVRAMALRDEEWERTCMRKPSQNGLHSYGVFAFTGSPPRARPSSSYAAQPVTLGESHTKSMQESNGCMPERCRSSGVERATKETRAEKKTRKVQGNNLEEMQGEGGGGGGEVEGADGGGGGEGPASASQMMSSARMQSLEEALRLAGGEQSVVQGLLRKIAAKNALRSDPSPSSASPQQPAPSTPSTPPTPPKPRHAFEQSLRTGKKGQVSRDGRAGDAVVGSGGELVRDFVYFRVEPDGQMKHGREPGLADCKLVRAKQEARRRLMSWIALVSSNCPIWRASADVLGGGGPELLHAPPPRGHSKGERERGGREREERDKGNVDLRLEVRWGEGGGGLAEMLHVFRVLSNGRFLRCEGESYGDRSGKGDAVGQGKHDEEGGEVGVWRPAGWLSASGREIAAVCPAIALKVCECLIRLVAYLQIEGGVDMPQNKGGLGFTV